MPDDQSPTGRHTQKGVISPGSLNPNLRRIRKKPWRLEDYTSGIQKGDRVTLAKAITLIESTRREHQALAQQIIEACLPMSGQSVRIGITGTPGVGKSTFIEAFGLHVLKEGRKLAVLAVDPTSQVTQGSILGDKTREAIILCEAAGYDTILIETVGVGQSETAVHSMTDFFLLLLLPGAGDELQGIKRGIVEMADLAVVNKADGERLPLAKQAKQEYRNAMHLFPPKESEWVARVEICSATTGMGIPEVWKDIQAYQEQTRANGYFEHNRRAQARYWLHETINRELRQLFFNHETVRSQLEEVERQVMNGQQSSFHAAEALLQAFREQK